MKRKIDDQIREYYGSQSLSNEARTRLRVILRTGAAKERWRSWRMKSGIAAAFLIVATVAALWLAVAPESPQQRAVTLARQAALGHNMKQELEFRVRECAELQSKMKSLDFTPVEPAMMQHMNMRLLGARYTTIDGAIAVQIFLVDEKGAPCTLYQVRPVEKLAQVPAGEHQIDGVRVSMWQEKGLLMVLARPLA